MPTTLPTWSIDEDIYHGFWINRSVGSFLGATLTLDRRAGGIVIAFLALFIGSTARSLWKVIRYSCHAFATAPTAQDGIYHQRQAILRNQNLALDSFLDLIRTAYAWRKRAEKVGLRILPVAFVALVVSIISIVAGELDL